MLQGLDGALAGVILCSFLFAEEAGVPMPIGGELAVIAGGGLIGTGALDPWLFVPLAIACCVGGAFTGYSWTRLVGQHGLKAAAERLHQGPRLAKITARFERAGPRVIALSRVTPGMRVYTSLVAGAVGVDRRRFLLVVGPVTVAWVLVFTALGTVAGAPVTHFLSQVQNLILHGGLLIVIGAGAYIAVRRIPEGGRAPLARLPGDLRVVLAVAVDMAMIATVVAGVLAILRGLLGLTHSLVPVLASNSSWVELPAIVLVIAVFYSAATHRGVNATAGETLLDTHYLTHRGEEPAAVHLKELLRHGFGQSPAPPSELVRMSALLRSIAETRQLEVARVLLREDASAAQVGSTLGLPTADAVDALGELEEAGLVVGDGAGADRRYTITSEHVRLGLAELLTYATSS